VGCGAARVWATSPHPHPPPPPSQVITEPTWVLWERCVARGEAGTAPGPLFIGGGAGGAGDATAAGKGDGTPAGPSAAGGEGVVGGELGAGGAGGAVGAATPSAPVPRAPPLSCEKWTQRPAGDAELARVLAARQRVALLGHALRQQLAAGGGGWGGGG